MATKTQTASVPTVTPVVPAKTSPSFVSLAPEANVAATTPVVATKIRKARGSPLVLPVGEFTIESFKTDNKVSYSTASNFLKPFIKSGKIKVIRTDRHGRGKPRNVLASP